MNSTKLGEKLKTFEDKINLKLDVLNQKIGKNIFSAKTSAIILAALVISVGSGIAYEQTTAYEVLYNGQSIGYVKNQNTFESAMDAVQVKLVETSGKENVFISDDIQLKPARTMGEKLDTEKCIEKIQETTPEVKVKGAAIIVDGTTVIQTDSKAIAEKSLEDFKQQYAQVEGATVLSIDIKQSVTVEEQDIDVFAAKNYDATMVYLKEGKETVAQTALQPGETDPTMVAANRGTTIDRLSALNTDKDINALKEGDVINMDQKTPVLTVKTVIQKQYQEEIPFETEEEKSDELAKGKEEEVQKGEKGSKDVDAIITYENGQETAKEVQTENITKEPVKAIKKIGTKEAASTSADKSSTPSNVSRGSISGSGQFLIPTSGLVGEIGRPGGGSSNHTNGSAVDILNGYGTPIYASAAGTVTRASDYGGYGNCIEIQHANGYTTLYGHLSTIDVRVGQTVGQGEYIGGTGSTGSSTANHLHFEVRIGGNAQLIQDYIAVSSGARV